MKTLLTILLITNIAQATGLKKPETDEKSNESLALSQHFKDFSNQQKGSTNWRSVGAGGCQYTTIQAAIDDYTQSALGLINIPVEFRIATNKTYFENLVIGGNYDIALTGGYSDCSSMGTGMPNNNQVLINAANKGVVITIQGVTTRRTMVFKNLRLINGSNAAGAGGGLLSDNSNVSLLLENVDIRNNTARNGAGIAIIGGDTDLLMNESLVLGNIADYGGGIYCSSSSAGADSSINVANQSGIVSNFADSPLSAAPNGRGGGVYIDGCYFAIFTGSDQNGSLTGMDLNSSVNIGGAIYAENAIIRLIGHQSCGVLGCLGDNSNPVSFRSNESASRFGTALGAVLYAKNSDVKMNAVWIEGNVGSSIINLDQSQFVLERTVGICWRNSDCNLIENNSGIVLKGLSNNDIDISNVNIAGNNNTVFDISFPAASTPATLPKFRVESCMINGNGANNNYLFDFFGPIDVKFVHNTIADNQVVQSIFRTDFNPNITVPTSFEIHSSIISNPSYNVYSYDALDFDNGSGVNMHVTVSASLLNETNSITAPATLTNDAFVYQGGPLLDTLDPLFIDRANGFYHLSSSSPAIDYINTTFRTLVVHSDIDYQGRGYDDPNVPDLASGGNFSYYDLGADERIVIDLIFANGFE